MPVRGEIIAVPLTRSHTGHEAGTQVTTWVRPFDLCADGAGLGGLHLWPH